jgi:glycosyltransferase involved in cell wall biosynthesis
MLIVVTIPAFNEQETIGVMVDQINQVMLSVNYSYKVLVLDDGSSDNTAKIARKAGAIVHSHPKNYGLADTFQTEIKKSLELGADIIIHIDADNQYLPKEIPLLIKEVENGADLVLGSRFKGKIESMPWIKKVGNIAFSKVISLITGTDISDAQTGFRAFTKSVAEDIDIISDHTYTQEQIIKAVRNKFKIVEVPVFFAKRKDKSRLIGNSIGYAIRAWINIIRIYRDYEPLKFFGVLGSLIFSLGFVIGLYLIYLHYTSGIIGHFALIMLDILILSIGFQIIIFGLLADMNRK